MPIVPLVSYNDELNLCLSEIKKTIIVFYNYSIYMSFAKADSSSLRFSMIVSQNNSGTGGFWIYHLFHSKPHDIVCFRRRPGSDGAVYQDEEICRQTVY